MKLRALRVHGFKSFADATKIEFHDGITAIVGPNGCGKSNISDAIRWVLGEQRPSAIRGGKMEEAIFQGTVNRRPVNRGSVSLTVSNEDGALPVPFQEVEIGRQVFRDGGSEYTINRSSVRLRDVVDLYRDTGLGANAYGMIENRMIDAILSDRADERRGLFEEAAGIGKYKDRRKAATRRLERAELDLQRLEDVIAEVQTKVRSLARQKGKAERYIEYRKRRLDVEVTVVRHQLDTLKERLRGVERELEGDQQSGEGMIAELRAAEAAYESLRLREVDAEKERIEASRKLEAVREQLVRWERDLAVSDERAAYAERRLAQIDEERTEARARAERMDRDATELEADRDRVREELGAVRGVAEARLAALQEVRDRLQGARERLEGVESRERELARRGAQLEGDAEACDAQAGELERRLERLTHELDECSVALTDLASQGDLFSTRVEDLLRAVEGARGEVDRRAAAVAAGRSELEAARSREMAAADRAASLGARRGALERLERDREGVEPAVKAALELGDEGVLGTLSDFIVAEADAARAAEAWLGPLARALVVRDGAALGRLHAWFSGSWRGGGGLILLPLDRVPERPEPRTARCSRASRRLAQELPGCVPSSARWTSRTTRSSRAGVTACPRRARWWSAVAWSAWAIPWVPPASWNARSSSARSAESTTRRSLQPSEPGTSVRRPRRPCARPRKPWRRPVRRSGRPRTRIDGRPPSSRPRQTRRTAWTGTATTSAARWRGRGRPGPARSSVRGRRGRIARCSSPRRRGSRPSARPPVRRSRRSRRSGRRPGRRRPASRWTSRGWRGTSRV